MHGGLRQQSLPCPERKNKEAMWLEPGGQQECVEGDKSEMTASEHTGLARQGQTFGFNLSRMRNSISFHCCCNKLLQTNFVA